MRYEIPETAGRGGESRTRNGASAPGLGLHAGPGPCPKGLQTAVKGTGLAEISLQCDGRKGDRHREAQRAGLLEESWDLCLQGHKAVSRARRGRDGPTEWSHTDRMGKMDEGEEEVLGFHDGVSHYIKDTA